MVKPIEDLEDGEWAVIEVEVVQLWDNLNESIRQVGLMGDDTGVIKFVSWEKSNLPLMQEGHWYKISHVVISSYNDRLQASLNSKTVITPVGVTPQQTKLPTV